MFASLLSILFAGLTLASIAYCIACIMAARKFFSTQLPSSPCELRPVTVMIPLCGTDFRAYENYASFCRQNYPAFQIVFGVRDKHDSSIEVVRKLMADFPEKDIALVIDPRTIGENLKVSNLNNILSQSKHELIVIADSDILVGPEFISTIIPELGEEGVGLVTCLYRGGEAPNTSSVLEAIGISTGFIPGVLLAHWKEGMSFALGATIATTKSVLQTVGGFEVLADYLADDYMLGNLAHRRGYKVRLSRYVVETILPPVNLKDMLKHQIRWARGMRVCRPVGYAGSVVTHGTVLAIFCVIAAKASTASLTLLFLTLLVRLCMACYVGIQCLGDEILRRNLWMLPARDLLGFAIWCIGLFGRKVEWRGKPFEVVAGGKMVPTGK